MQLAPGYLKRSEEKAACVPFGKHLGGTTDNGENWKYLNAHRKRSLREECIKLSKLLYTYADTAVRNDMERC